MQTYKAIKEKISRRKRNPLTNKERKELMQDLTGKAMKDFSLQQKRKEKESWDSVSKIKIG